MPNRLTSAEQLGSEPQHTPDTLQAEAVQASRATALAEAEASLATIQEVVIQEISRLREFASPIGDARSVTSTVSLLVHTFGQIEGQQNEIRSF